MRGDLVSAWNYNASVLVLGAIAVVVMASVMASDLVRGGPRAVRARVATLTGPRAGGRGTTAPMVVFFALWWAWNLARW